MKMTNAFLLILLIFATKCQLKEFGETPKTCEDYQPNNSKGNNAFSLDFCRTLSYDATKNKCCYYQYEDSNEITHYHCLQLTLSEFADIDDYIDNVLENEKSGIEVDKLDCHSSYLYASLLLIFALIF